MSRRRNRKAVNGAATSNSTGNLASECSAAEEESLQQNNLSDPNDGRDGARPKIRGGKAAERNLQTVKMFPSGDEPVEEPPPRYQDVLEDCRVSQQLAQDTDSTCVAHQNDSQQQGHIAFDPNEPPTEEMSLRMLMQEQGERFRVGDVIFEAAPLAYVLNQEENKFRCDRCLFKRPLPEKCEKCNFVSYCSSVCKEEAWKALHKLECESLKNRATEGISDLMRYFALLILVVKDPSSNQIADQVGRHLVNFSNLKSYEKEIFKSDYNRNYLYESYQCLLEYLGPHQMVPFYKYRTILAKTLLYTKKITFTQLPIGCGLYMGDSLFNHACLPTACFTFAGPILRVTCVTEIPQQHAGLVTLNRHHIIDSKEGRSEFLRNHYFFDDDCKCRGCEDSAYVEACEKVTNKKKAENIERQLGDIMGPSFSIIQVSTEREVNAIIDICERCLTLMGKVYGRFHVKRLMVLRTLVYALFDGGHFAKCKESIVEYLAIFSFYFGNPHPYLAGILFLLAQTEMFLGRRQEAKEAMEKGLRLAGMCHGDDHPYYNHMRSVYSDCKKAKWCMGILIKTYPRYLDDF